MLALCILSINVIRLFSIIVTIIIIILQLNRKYHYFYDFHFYVHLNIIMVNIFTNIIVIIIQNYKLLQIIYLKFILSFSKWRYISLFSLRFRYQKYECF